MHTRTLACMYSHTHTHAHERTHTQRLGGTLAGHSHEEGDAGVGHGVGEAQDAAAHDGVAQVKH